MLSLFNAMNGTNYDNPDDLEITTLESAIYLSYKNGVSPYFIFRVRELLQQGLKDDAYQEGIKEGIRNLIESLQELGIAKELVQTKIMEKYDISKEELEKLLEKYWQYK